MTDEADQPAGARAIVDANLYLVLGTADAAGGPWVSPVYFAHAGYRDFYWVSAPAAQHSRNIAARREVSVVVFDSSVAIGQAAAVYMSAEAEEVTGAAREHGIGVFSARSLAHGGHEWTLADVEAPARLRLYRARAVEQFVLGRGDERLPVTMADSS
jgi:hypothetical protein